MAKLWQAISRKDFLFGILIFVLVLLISIFQPSNKILVEFGETAVDVKSAQFTMNIPYTMVETIELVDRPDPGKEVDGHDDMILLTGTWENDTWGEYTACIEGATDNCIVVYLNDGRIFVISRRDNEETTKVFEEFQLHLQ